ncbi:hypothetical protein BT96DRAFT_1009954 [Gymnopus androsaceus JB14]|uniref:Uncharacterized protein n=1 Tax=Gymnopus androsaceus JB14 TaxID=1447944 RepID=A0A6A4GBT0_9AGAR|nr:hypothetical protein BT96DRAFT_1009954 [Gymnopus androsaceus JB14]
MPCIGETVKMICGREPSKGVNPDEAVAKGIETVNQPERYHPTKKSVRDNKLLGNFNLIGAPQYRN